MQKFMRMILISLLLASVFSMVFVLGCEEEAAPEEPEPTAEISEISQQQLQQILLDSMLALKDVESYKMKIDMDMTMNISGGPEEGTADMIMAMEGAIDQVNMEMQMTMNMSMNMVGADVEESLQDMSMEMYMVTDSMYMKMDIPELGEQWIKMPLSKKMMEAYNFNMVDQQLALLESPGEVTLLRYESIDDSECYVIHLVPDLEKIIDWLDQQQMTEMELAWEELSMLSDIFKELTYICWIAKDTKYMKKMTANMLMEMSADDFTEMEDDFGTMTMGTNMDMIMYDHNKTVSIVLPDEAENAMEMPQFGDMMK